MNRVCLEYDKELIWQSNWDGHELGYDEVEVIGLYTLKDTTLNFYIDMENNMIITSWDENYHQH